MLVSKLTSEWLSYVRVAMSLARISHESAPSFDEVCGRPFFALVRKSSRARECFFFFARGNDCRIIVAGFCTPETYFFAQSTVKLLIMHVRFPASDMLRTTHVQNNRTAVRDRAR